MERHHSEGHQASQGSCTVEDGPHRSRDNYLCQRLLTRHQLGSLSGQTYFSEHPRNWERQISRSEISQRLRSLPHLTHGRTWRTNLTRVVPL
jgi:hypothetical protein